MDVAAVYGIIHGISAGLERACAECLSRRSGIVLLAVTEQLYSGLDGDGAYLSPTYDDDPYFEEEGVWQGRAAAYKAWKKKITPPARGGMLGLPPRPEEVPNLFINGRFYSGITASPAAGGLSVTPGGGDGPSIVAKYGERILALGDEAVRYFNDEFMLPAIAEHFKRCGYR